MALIPLAVESHIDFVDGIPKLVIRIWDERKGAVIQVATTNGEAVAVLSRTFTWLQDDWDRAPQGQQIAEQLAKQNIAVVAMSSVAIYQSPDGPCASSVRPIAISRPALYQLKKHLKQLRRRPQVEVAF